MPYKPWEPQGGGGGQDFDDFMDLGGPEDAFVYSLQVNHNGTLDHLVVTYQQGNRFPVFPHGTSDGGTHLREFTIDLRSGERLVKVELWHHEFDGTRELNGLKFWTNFGRPSDLFGNPDDTYASFDATLLRGQSCEICAFFGRQGLFVNALGVYARPIIGGSV
jgi:hypothetical protein